jgi:hypothetical protein
MQGVGQPVAQDRRVEQLLPRAEGLVADPAATDEEPTVVVDEQEQARSYRARRSWMGHEGTDQHSPIQRSLGASAS